MDLDGRYRFDRFVVGSANRLAATAARTVADSPGTVYNPLFIWSAPGLGKTHLLTAIGHQALSLRPTVRVDVLSLDEFVRQLHAAVSMGDTGPFRDRFRDTGMLLIDDVQFLSGRRETQRELIRLCDVLQGDGRQIVFTGDRPPTDIADMDDGLIERLSAGLVVDMGVPDLDTRVVALNAWSSDRGVCFGPGAVEALGRVEVRSMRELRGALNRLIAHQSASGRGATVGVADVHRLFPESREPPRSANGTGLRTSGAVASAPAAEFLNFVSEVAHVVARHVEPWRTRIGEAAAWWTREGYQADVLERALRAVSDPGSEALIATYEQSVAQLQALETEAAAIDPALATLEVFRDPTRVNAAAALVARARADAAAHAAATLDIEVLEVLEVVEHADVVEDIEPAQLAEAPVPAARPAPRTSRGATRTPVAVEDTFFLDDEKVVWDWPDAAGRVIEEFR